MVHAVAILAGSDERLVGLLQGGAHAVGPVVEHDDPLEVVAAGLVGRVDDERRIEAAVDLRAVVGVEPVGPGVGDDEVVLERAACTDLGGGQSRDAVHIVADRQAVPVHARGFR